MKVLLKGEIDKIEYHLLKDIRVVNYAVMNEKEKVTYGLKVKNVKISNRERMINRDVVIILSTQCFENYDALIGLSVLEGGFENGNITTNESKSKEIFC